MQIIEKEKSFADEVAKRLRASAIHFEREVAVHGLRLDFVIPSGRNQIILEIKSFRMNSAQIRDALSQLDYYQKVTQTENAFLVVNDLPNSLKNSEKVLTLDNLSAVLLNAIVKPYYPPPTRRSIARADESISIFAAMPFDSQYDDVFYLGMVYAADKVNAVYNRVDKEDFSGDIVERIKQMIRESKAVIVDLSEAKPNVLYEAGFAHALPRPTIHICSTPLTELPFDVSHWNTIAYKRGQVHDLRDKLANRLRSVMSK